MPNDPHKRAEEIFMLLRRAVPAMSYEVISFYPEEYRMIFNFGEFQIERRINFDEPNKYVATQIAHKYVEEMIDK